MIKPRGSWLVVVICIKIWRFSFVFCIHDQIITIQKKYLVRYFFFLIFNFCKIIRDSRFFCITSSGTLCNDLTIVSLVSSKLQKNLSKLYQVLIKYVKSFLSLKFAKVYPQNLALEEPYSTDHLMACHLRSQSHPLILAMS